MLIVDPDTGRGARSAPTRASRRSPTDEVIRDGDRVTGVEGYESLNLGTLSAEPGLHRPMGGAPAAARRRGAGSYLRPDLRHARDRGAAGLRLRRGPGRDGQHRRPARCSPRTSTIGNFVSATTGERPCSRAGWSTSGSRTTSSLLTDDGLRSAFLPITVWTFFFAFATTFLNFSLGLCWRSS